MNTETAQVHYFASTCYNWATGATPAAALQRVAKDLGTDHLARARKADGGVAVFVCKVHAPAGTPYQINWFVPRGVEISGETQARLLNHRGHCMPTCD